METQLRRSRMRRTRTGKRIELTARDIEIFKLLERYRYLRSTFIHAFVGGASETRFKERLGHLYHEGGYLDRPSQQWEFAKSRYMPVVYENGEGARRALCECGVAGGEAGTLLGQGTHRQFAHTLMICEILASMELGARADPNLRFISSRRILAKAPENTRNSPHPFRIPVPLSQVPRDGRAVQEGAYVLPDGLFGLEYAVGEKRSYRFFALEADRATMPVFRSNPNQTSYLRKMPAYREIIARQMHRAHWGIPNLLVLTVTTNEGHLAEILRRFEGQIGGHAAFLFKTVGSGAGALTAPAPQLLSEPWQRAGLPPFRIDESD